MSTGIFVCGDFQNTSFQYNRFYGNEKRRERAISQEEMLVRMMLWEVNDTHR